MTELLQQKLKQSQLLALKKELMVQKLTGSPPEQAVSLEPKLDLLLEKTKELQKLVREERQSCPVCAERGPCLLPPAHPVSLFFRLKLTFPKRYNGRP